MAVSSMCGNIYKNISIDTDVLDISAHVGLFFMFAIKYDTFMIIGVGNN